MHLLIILYGLVFILLLISTSMVVWANFLMIGFIFLFFYDYFNGKLKTKEEVKKKEKILKSLFLQSEKEIMQTREKHYKNLFKDA